MPERYSNAVVLSHSVNLKGLLKQIETIREEGGLNRYIFRNEDRVSKIIKSILEFCCDMLPLSIAVEVAENERWHMPSHEKEK